MAEQDNSQEKTLDPTQKRLDKAKEDGEILSSKEMFVFGSSFMGLIVLFIISIIFVFCFFNSSLIFTNFWLIQLCVYKCIHSKSVEIKINPYKNYTV